MSDETQTSAEVLIEEYRPSIDVTIADTVGPTLNHTGLVELATPSIYVPFLHPLRGHTVRTA